MKRLLFFLSMSALMQHGVAQEICNNGLDDDGNGLTDCLDSACTSNTVPTGALFNTANNGSGGVLPGGSNDNNWQVSVGSLTGPYVPAIVMSSIPVSYYASPWADCDWISHNAMGTHTFDEDFYYKIEFLLPCYNSCGTSFYDSATFCLNMDFFSDNSVDEVYVNSIPQSAYLAGVPSLNPYYNVGFSAAGGLSFSLCRDWQPGLNTLIIKVSSGPGYEGFLAQNSTSAPPPVTIDPTILTSTSGMSMCDSSSAVDFNAVTGGGLWSADCGSCIDSATGVFDPSAAGPGTHIITYTLSAPCTGTDTALVQVLPLSPAATILPEPVHCLNDPPFNLSAGSPGGTWSGTGIINSAAGTFDPAISGAGSFTVIYYFPGSCGDTASIIVSVSSPSPSFTADITSGCEPLCVEFSDAPGSGCSVLMYYFGDGDSSAVSSPQHCYTQEGTYTVTLSCTDINGCTSSSSIPGMITAYPNPVAGFIPSPAPVIGLNTALILTNTSTGAGSYYWEFDDPGSGADNTSSLASPSHSFANEGEYCILLIASSSQGCIDSMRYCIIAEGESTIFIPNVFSPNSDLDNDIFQVSSHRMKEISYVIYDRWGLKMAEHNGLTGGWNGEAPNGKMAPDGTYFYVLKAITGSGKQIEKQGFIQLVAGNR